MRLLIDADGCPVVDIALGIARDNNIECHIFCDTCHIFEKQGAETHVVPKGADSADFALANFARRGDIVITQDYGLASMSLSRGAICINQDGNEYNELNIDGLLFARHTAKKVRNAGGRIKGPPKRTREQDARFSEKLREMAGRMAK